MPNVASGCGVADQSSAQGERSGVAFPVRFAEAHGNIAMGLAPTRTAMATRREHRTLPTTRDLPRPSLRTILRGNQSVAPPACFALCQHLFDFWRSPR